MECSGPEVQTPDRADLARLQGLAAFLSRARAAVRFVDYRQAEQDCELLAARLREAHSDAELASMRFVGVPRGGLVVLGMLSYVLHLAPRQLRPSPASDAPLVLVDDCALTGKRLHRELRRLGDRPVTIALLYAHPDLRHALVEREPTVRHCLAARALGDRAPELYPDPRELDRWRREWAARLAGERYWLGLADLVCFSWSEPDRLFWNPVSQRVESGWRFLPGELCLGNRLSGGLPARAARPRRWRVDPTVVVGSFDDAVLLYRGSSDEVFRLAGVAAAIWQGLSAWGNAQDVLDHLRSTYDAEPGRLEADLDRFVASLLEAGLLESVTG